MDDDDDDGSRRDQSQQIELPLLQTHRWYTFPFFPMVDSASCFFCSNHVHSKDYRTAMFSVFQYCALSSAALRLEFDDRGVGARPKLPLLHR